VAVQGVADRGDDGDERGWDEVSGYAGDPGEMSGFVLNRGAGRGESGEERYPRDGRKQRGDLDGQVAIVCVRAGAPQQPQGEELRAGDLILGGSFTRPTSAARGDVLHADYGPLGGISMRFV